MQLESALKSPVPDLSQWWERQGAAGSPGKLTYLKGDLTVAVLATAGVEATAKSDLLRGILMQLHEPAPR